MKTRDRTRRTWAPASRNWLISATERLPNCPALDHSHRVSKNPLRSAPLARRGEAIRTSDSPSAPN